MTDPLTTVGALSTQYKVHSRRIQAVLEAANIKPLQIVPFGKHKMALYEREAADAALRAAFEESSAPQQPDARDAIAPLIRALRDEFAAMVERLARNLTATLGDIELKVDTALAGATKISDQNVLLLRAFTDMRADVLSKVDALQHTVDHLPLAAAAPPDAPPDLRHAKHDPAPTPEDRLTKRRITIVGLPGQHVQAVEREFGKCFELRFLAGDVSSGKLIAGQVAHSWAVLVMASLTSSHGGIWKALRDASGDRLHMVSGGLSSLRDKLTALFVEEGAHA